MAPNSPACSFIHASMAGSRSTAPLNRSNSVLIVAPFSAFGISSCAGCAMPDPPFLPRRQIQRSWRAKVGQTLFDYLEENYTLEEFLACFPSVTREMACRVLECSEMALLSKSKGCESC